MRGGETNPFFEFFHEIAVPLFDRQATHEMITVIGAAMDVAVEAEFIDQLHNLTGGHPSFSRSFAAEASRRQATLRRLTSVDLTSARQAMLENGTVDAFLQSNIWDPLTPAEKQVVSSLARGEDSVTASGTDADHQLQQAEFNLREQGLIVGRQVTMGALVTWLREREVGVLQ
jgi:hypothetical protein